jgi:hypothetical protein
VLAGRDHHRAVRDGGDDVGVGGRPGAQVEVGGGDDLAVPPALPLPVLVRVLVVGRRVVGGGEGAGGDPALEAGVADGVVAVPRLAVDLDLGVGREDEEDGGVVLRLGEEADLLGGRADAGGGNAGRRAGGGDAEQDQEGDEDAAARAAAGALPVPPRSDASVASCSPHGPAALVGRARCPPQKKGARRG